MAYYCWFYTFIFAAFFPEDTPACLLNCCSLLLSLASDFHFSLDVMMPTDLPFTPWFMPLAVDDLFRSIWLLPLLCSREPRRYYMLFEPRSCIKG